MSRKYYTILFGTFVSIGMSFVMSFVLTLINAGFDSYFWERWFRAFLIGFLVGLPTSFTIIPIVRKIVDKLTAAA